MDMARPLQEEYDLIIVGSGGGSMAGALAAKQAGKSVVILEKQDKVGGSTSFSGGVWWVPANHLLEAAGIHDSIEKARQYFDNVVTYKGPGVTPRRRDALLAGAPRVIKFLVDLGLKVRRPRDDWPDYYDDRPGGLPEGRSLMAEPLNLNDLGAWKDRIALYPPAYGMPIGADEFSTLFLFKRTFAGKLKAMRFAMLMLRDKLLGRVSACNGAAIQGRMLQIALKHDVDIQLSTPVVGLVAEAGRVSGVRVLRDGKEVTLRARSGVICNVGGFSRNDSFRKQMTGGLVGNEWTSANPGDTGEVLQEMIALGAQTDCLDTAWWVVTSQNLNGTWPDSAIARDGSVRPYFHHLDLSLPHVILVDQTGRRVANEAGSYMDIGENMMARERETGKGLPCWAIFDARHRERYPWGNEMPGKTPEKWIETGYMKRAATLDELADQCGIDREGLRQEVSRFNHFCSTGNDEDFARGNRAFDRSHGDPSVKPNPNLGAIAEGPFYACAIFPGDVGTAGGVVADEYARVLNQDGAPISGLYAIGNSTASVFGRCYPAAGASIIASFVFGYAAVLHATGSEELNTIISPQ
ncbi:FAD-binding protein [Sphingobium sp. JS3065]|uniref:FAD-binding protein n=1 Tax=Sphingobium sp. JS3065 TaxID=2970925 RepID=UPI0022653F6C|nr:FAD-binding protein [Sphingobium sp. JS3065]UZW57354.1 FAD-binding protein [Sphingobium sp. JS3065]